MGVQRSEECCLWGGGFLRGVTEKRTDADIA